jgi:hypothetical protein
MVLSPPVRQQFQFLHYYKLKKNQVIGDHNINHIRSRRSEYQRQCRDERSSQAGILHSLATVFFDSEGDDSPSVKPTSLQPSSLVPCDYTFLDFGANIGDSLGKFIDSGIEPCPGKDLDQNPRLDLDSIKFGESEILWSGPAVSF